MDIKLPINERVLYIGNPGFGSAFEHCKSYEVDSFDAIHHASICGEHVSPVYTHFTLRNCKDGKLKVPSSEVIRGHWLDFTSTDRDGVSISLDDMVKFGYDLMKVVAIIACDYDYERVRVVIKSRFGTRYLVDPSDLIKVSEISRRYDETPYGETSYVEVFFLEDGSTKPHLRKSYIYACRVAGIKSGDLVNVHSYSGNSPDTVVYVNRVNVQKRGQIYREVTAKVDKEWYLKQLDTQRWIEQEKVQAKEAERQKAIENAKKEIARLKAAARIHHHKTTPMQTLKLTTDGRRIADRLKKAEAKLRNLGE